MRPRLVEVVESILNGELIGHGEEITAIAFSPDSMQLATASSDHTVRLWSVGNGNCMKMLNLQEKVNSVVFSPNTSIVLLQCLA